MAWVEINVYVEGSLEEWGDYHDYTLIEQRIREIAQEAEATGYKFEVYTLRHDHPYGDHPCSCIDYVTDHKPTYIFPRDQPPAEDEHPFAP